MTDRSDPRRLKRWSIYLTLLVAVWLVSGIERVGPDEFGVLDGLLLGGRTRLVEQGTVLAPAGLLTLTTYPRYGLELSLPQADRAMLRSVDGSRFGFRGFVTVRARPEAFEALHRAADGRGIRNVLLEAVREAAGAMRPGTELDRDTTVLTRQLADRLTETLASRGLDLRRLELDSVDFLTVQEGSEPPRPTETKLLLIGLDGLDWEIVDGLVEAGRLPNLERLIDGGARAKLLTISPMLSPVIWTTVATGVEPSRHGVLDFLVQDATGESRQPVTSAQRQVPTMWELLSRAGVEVGVTAWWATWPAEPVRGYLVSDRIAYQLFGYRADPASSEGKTWPPELYEERVRPRIVPPDNVDWQEVLSYLGGDRRRPEAFDGEDATLLDEFRTLLASGKTYLSIAQDLRREFAPKFEAAYFEGTDTIGHLFMRYRPPRLPGVADESFAAFSGVVDRYYETIDGYVGQLLEDRGEDWTVMVVSDHGFASDATRPRTTDSRVGHGAAADWHRRFGVLILSGAGIRPGTRLDEASVYDIAPTVMALFGQPIPRSWPGRVLAGAIDESFLDQYPVRYRLDDPARSELTAEGMIDPAAADLLEKLESLGYVSSGAEGAESVTARNNAGVALMAEGRFEEAEQEFRAGLEAAPGSPMLELNLGLAQRLQGRTDEAMKRFRAALDHPITRRMAGHLLAQILLERDELDEAERVLLAVLADEPDAAEVRNTLGQVYERRGRIDAARAEYERAAELDPNAALPRNHLGNLARRVGDSDGAERWYRRAIDADPYFMGAYNNLALVYQERGEMERAHDLYAQALDKSPGNADVLNNFGSWHYARGEFDEARKYWLRAAAADRRNPSPLNNVAGLEINAGRYDEAESLLRRALELDPDYGDARINLSIVLMTQGRTDAAREQLERAVEDPRTGAGAWAKLGALELEAGETARAVEVLERARAVDPTHIESLNYLGEAYRRQGRVEEALAVWRESLALQPDQPRLRRYIDSGAVGGAG
jgi:tetratricopeptide (TPR) repeat protein/predicted AlkP superfamily phosphohydrolase/phosphomutase